MRKEDGYWPNRFGGRYARPMAADSVSRLGITCGDPASIGPEVVARLLADLPPSSVRPVVYADKRILDMGSRVAGVSLPLEAFDFVNVTLPGEIPDPGEVVSSAGAHAFAVLEAVGGDLTAGLLAGVVTGPVHKGAIRLSRPDFIGHTEFFAALGNVARYGMLLVVEPFRALHVTTHIALRDVAKAITSARILETLDLGRDALEMLGESERVIGVCGLNPHAGEGGAFGDEEERLIAPAIAKARQRGIRAEGPVSPDAAFLRAARGDFGLIVCMYHDQGHIALKLVGMDRGVNVTIGLPFVRTSVDHGTAFDIAGKGIADAGSLKAAWLLACRLVENGVSPQS